MVDLYKVRRYKDPGNHRHSLEEDRKHGKSQVPVESRAQVAGVDKEDAYAGVVNEADEEHPDLPTQLMLIVMVKLKDF